MTLTGTEILILQRAADDRRGRATCHYGIDRGRSGLGRPRQYGIRERNALHALEDKGLVTVERSGGGGGVATITSAGRAAVAFPLVCVERESPGLYRVRRDRDVLATFYFSRSPSKRGPQVSAWYHLGHGPRVETSHAYFNDIKAFVLALVGAAHAA